MKLQFSTKFLDEIKDKKQLQRFLGCLNYIHNFFKDLGIICKLLYNRLKDNPEPWTQKHTNIIKYIKQKVSTLPCLNLPHLDAKIIVETDASDIGFGGILKQKFVNSTEEQLVRYYSGAWNDTQKKLFNCQKGNFKHCFIIDCQSAKTILEKDVKNIISKQIFARWQALLEFTTLFLQSKLVTPKVTSTDTISPFAKPITPQTQKFVTPSLSTKIPYVLNPNFLRVQILEDVQIHKLHQGFHILTNHLFGQGKAFYVDSYKTREYYQAILQESGLVNFVHRSNSKEGNIDFSKSHIIKIISPESWVPNLHSEKPLISYPAYPRFSYYDYQDAWTKAFFIRNYSHSWFIFFDLNFNCEYPRWFINWYKYMRILRNCLPKEIYAGCLKFKELFIQQIQEFEYMLQFTMIFKVPWIMSWTFHYQEAKDSSPPWLNRQFRSKWWDKMKISQASEQAVEATFINNLPKSDVDLIARIKDAATSSPEKLQKLLQEIRQTSSVSDSSPKSIKNDLFEDAQDPFDDPYEE
uniref:Reverse transcriptase/retrotransposon-derived protein RNase H-like domain-containing protein n=1 Tax=Lactuca sativa TaxID=4236 RepID=A0A9R1WGS3_LACSA|nr:hypothetical protein LSAT_V11C200061950 [Lactuca sativa]